MRGFQRGLWSAVLSVLGLCAASAADSYEIDAAHTTVGFSVAHLVISDVHGKFKTFSGTILVDEQDPAKSSVDVRIEVGSIDTADEKRDEHLRGPDFFDAKKHPQITFKSEKIAKDGKGFVATGTLTLKGVAKTVSIPFAAAGPIVDPWGKTRRGFKGSLKLNRQDFGVSWSKTLDGGGLMVGDEVTVDLSVEAVKK